MNQKYKIAFYNFFIYVIMKIIKMYFDLYQKIYFDLYQFYIHIKNFIEIVNVAMKHKYCYINIYIYKHINN